ncbi:homoserine dehydrogenase [Bacillus sp. FJAT-45350]|uniref:homoserine dehydrogenase n=1 Tax=Bacillus sp. FJAT-45350 TaxID=2011014 RepID=UPI000BB7976D|nr:homoserine dehydrogenase [Bacillus sp. FJAT-45350]
MLSVGLIGFGTVGTGVYERIEETRSTLESLLQQEISITKILVSNREKERELSIDKTLLTDNEEDFFKEEYDLVFEAIGGTIPAKDYVSSFLNRGIPVITANKELVAKHGKELEELANEHDTFLGYEATVAGGIPIVNALKANLATSPIHKVLGILNGTTNYILTEMNEKGKGFEEALTEAQELGFAEADPTDDIEGFDSWYKIRILSRLCFGEWPEEYNVRRTGITKIEKWKVTIAEELGLTIKLIGEAKKINGTIKGSVAPAFVTKNHSFSHIKSVSNAVQVVSEWFDNLSFTGPGAGKKPTANSMIEDFVFHFHNKSSHLVKLQAPIQNNNFDETRLLLFSNKDEEKPLKEKLQQFNHKIEQVYCNGERLVWVITISEVELEGFQDTIPNCFPIFGDEEIVKLNKNIVSV